MKKDAGGGVSVVIWGGYEGQPADRVLHQKKMQQYREWCGGRDLRRSEAKEAGFWINCLDRYSFPAPDQHQGLTLHWSNRCVGVIILDRLALHEVVERIAQPKLAGEFQD